MKNAEKIESLFWRRDKFLQLMQTSLRLYQEYQDEFYYDYAQKFGTLSKEIKDEMTQRDIS